MLYQINNIKIDTLSFHLIIDEITVAVEPQVFDLIIYLIIYRNRLVTRNELLDHIWSGKVVSDNSLSTHIKKARQVLGDDGNQQKLIKTIHGRGFQFIGNVEELSPPHEEGNTPFIDSDHYKSSSLFSSKAGVYAKPEEKPLNLPDKPSVAVMDFVDIGASPSGALFAYGLTADISATLSRLPNLFISARASVTKLTQVTMSAKAMARRLGVHYLIYGNTQLLNNRVTITLTVVDGVNDTELWSEHFDRSFDDLYNIQKDIVDSIVVAIDVAIEQSEIARAFLIPTEDLSAWENYHRAIWHSNRTTMKDINKSQCYFKNAIALDSRFSRAYAGLSYSYMNSQLLKSINTDNYDDLEKAHDYAKQSIDHCQFESMGHMSLGRTLFFSHKPAQALQSINHGLALNPNYSQCHAFKGVITAHAGCTTQSEVHLGIAERLSPLSSLLFSMRMAQATSLVRQLKYTDAAKISLQATQYSNAYFTTYALAAGCFQLAGQLNKARKYANKLLEIKPGYSTEAYLKFLPFSEESTKQLITHAMQDAGIPALNINNN